MVINDWSVARRNSQSALRLLQKLYDWLLGSETANQLHELRRPQRLNKNIAVASKKSELCNFAMKIEIDIMNKGVLKVNCKLVDIHKKYQSFRCSLQC